MKTLLLGYGISNKSIGEFFESKNIYYDVYDDKYSLKNIDINDYDLLVKSSGILNDHKIIKEAKSKGIDIVTDLELFYKYTKAKEIILITGTNGKTTTASLLAHILDCIVIGNNGVPLFDYVNYPNTVVIEASSFMGEYINSFKADIYGVLDIKESHLEHHESFENYLDSKCNLIKNIGDNDFIIYNFDSSLLQNKLSKYKGYHININDVIIKDGIVFIDNEEITNINDIKYITNIENIKMAILIAYLKNIDPYIINKKIHSFNGIDYRVKFLRDYKGIKIYNDSKSTNIYALNNALDFFKDKKVLLLCGGKNINKNIKINNYPKYVITCGENNEVLKEYFITNNIPCNSFITLKEGLDYLISNINNYDIDVLLFSPGAQSYDEFQNFEKRGQFFEKYILNNL